MKNLILSTLILICIGIISCESESPICAPDDCEETGTTIKHEQKNTDEFAIIDGKFVSPRQRRAVIGDN